MAEFSKPDQERRDRLTIGLHWATAILVAIQFVIGKTAPLLPRSPLRVDIWSMHVVFGFVLCLVILAGVFWRWMRGRDPATDGGALHALASLTHHLLEVLLIIIAALGVLNVFAHAFPLFNAVDFPRLGDLRLMRRINAWHALTANILIVIALFHGAAALFHHYVLRDDVLRRMWPGFGGREVGR